MHIRIKERCDEVVLKPTFARLDTVTMQPRSRYFFSINERRA
jgi:hypothetical protein